MLNFPSVEAMLASLDPVAPVYCVHPQRYADAVQEFTSGFPGRVLFAVKANNDPVVLDELTAAGVAHFDCASLNEIALISNRYPDATCYFMSPVRLPFRIRLVDIGGGFPYSYPAFEMPPLRDYFDVITASAAALPLADNAELLAEPGRALAAPGMSTVTRVLLRKSDRIYINDGMYGCFWELRFDGHKQLPVRVFRECRQHRGDEAAFLVYGPTCDSTDRLPEAVHLPRDIRDGDFIEFDTTGAYSLSGRTDFNGFYSNTVVRIPR